MMVACAVASAQTAPGRQPSIPTQNLPSPTEQQKSSSYTDPQAEKELQTGTHLTRRGEFTEAIPHLVAARGRIVNDYAADFNLALCYVATGQPQRAIPLLTSMRNRAHDNAGVNNLLAQAYIVDSQDEKALEALQRAASFTPVDEKLYMFVADACMGQQAYPLGLQVVDLGLKNLPNSAQLHFERGMFLTLVDRFDDAKGDFDQARTLAPESEVAYIAGAQETMFAGNISEAVRVSRQAIANGHHHFLLLTLLGEALLRSGIAPGQKEFEEARQALEAAVAQRANYPSSQLALGKLYLLGGHTPAAIAHLEKARELSPGNPSVYSSLASAYRKGTLAKLNEAQAERIRMAPGETKTSYGGASQQH